MKAIGMRNWYLKRTLGTKFTVLFIGIFVVGIGMAGVVLDDASNRIAQNGISSRSEALLETMNAVRTYTGTEVNPLLADELYTEGGVYRADRAGVFGAHCF